jgi:hypothetical protein
MKYSAKNADNTEIRYDQTNNIIERFLFDMKTSSQSKFWLESCNVCSCACAVEAVGGLWKCKIPELSTKQLFGYDDLLFFFLYSTYGRTKIVVKDGEMENEIPANLVVAINECTTCKAELKTFADKKVMVEEIKKSLKNGCSIVLSYLTDYNSGHYITVVQYDDITKSFVCYDSWSDNKHCKNGGKKEIYTEDFFITRARERYIEVKC